MPRASWPKYAPIATAWPLMHGSTSPSNGCGDPHTSTTLGDLAAFTRSLSFARDALTW